MGGRGRFGCVCTSRLCCCSSGDPLSVFFHLREEAENVLHQYCRVRDKVRGTHSNQRPRPDLGRFLLCALDTRSRYLSPATHKWEAHQSPQPRLRDGTQSWTDLSLMTIIFCSRQSWPTRSSSAKVILPPFSTLFAEGLSRSGLNVQYSTKSTVWVRKPSCKSQKGLYVNLHATDREIPLADRGSSGWTYVNQGFPTSQNVQHVTLEFFGG